MLQLIQSHNNPDPTWSNSVRSFLLAKQVEGYSKKTLIWYSYIFRGVTKFIGQNVPLPSIHVGMVRECLHQLEEQGLSKVSLHDHQRGLKTFFRWCVSEGLISVDPTVGIHKIKIPNQFPKFIPEEEVEKLLKVCNRNRYEGKRHYAMISLFLDTGIRLTELLNLFPADLNLLNRSLMIRCGKGGKSRMAFIGKRTYAALRKWLEARHCSLEAPLFCSRNGEQLKGRNVAWILDRLASKAKLKSKISPHKLRHTAATLMAKAGINAFELAQLLGHADVKTTMIYCHLGGMALREAHAKVSPMDRLFESL